MTGPPEDAEMVETPLVTLETLAVVAAPATSTESPLSASDASIPAGAMAISPSGETLLPSAPYFCRLSFKEDADGRFMGRIPEGHPLDDPNSAVAGGPARFFPLFLLTFALSSFALVELQLPNCEKFGSLFYAPASIPAALPGGESRASPMLKAEFSGLADAVQKFNLPFEGVDIFPFQSHDGKKDGSIELTRIYAPCIYTGLPLDSDAHPVVRDSASNVRIPRPDFLLSMLK